MAQCTFDWLYLLAHFFGVVRRLHVNESKNIPAQAMRPQILTVRWTMLATLELPMLIFERAASKLLYSVYVCGDKWLF